LRRDYDGWHTPTRTAAFKVYFIIAILALPFVGKTHPKFMVSPPVVRSVYKAGFCKSSGSSAKKAVRVAHSVILGRDSTSASLAFGNLSRAGIFATFRRGVSFHRQTQRASYNLRTHDPSFATFLLSAKVTFLYLQNIQKFVEFLGFYDKAEC